AVLGLFGQVAAVGVLEVVEVGGAEEGTPVAPVQAQLRGDLDRVGDGVAVVVLEVAVVTVGGEAAQGAELLRGARHAAAAGAAARTDRDGAERHVLGAQQRVEPGLGDQVVVPILDAPGIAVGYGGIETA